MKIEIGKHDFKNIKTKEIHKKECKYCPSYNDRLNGRIDPESEEISTYPKEIIAKEFLFVCAWRTDKLCKGLCDNMGIDEEYLKSLNFEHKKNRGVFKLKNSKQKN